MDALSAEQISHHHFQKKSEKSSKLGQSSFSALGRILIWVTEALLQKILNKKSKILKRQEIMALGRGGGGLLVRVFAS